MSDAVADFEGVARGIERAAHALDRTLDDAADGHATLAQFNLATGDAGSVQEVVDQARQQRDLAIDHRDRV